MDFDESCRVSGEMKARAWLIGDSAGTLIGLYHRGVEFARIMCTTSGAVSKEDMKEVNTADWFAMAGPHVREGVREVIAEAYWTKVGIVGGAVSLHLMFKELQEGHVK